MNTFITTSGGDRIAVSRIIRIYSEEYTRPDGGTDETHKIEYDAGNGETRTAIVYRHIIDDALGQPLIAAVPGHEVVHVAFHNGSAGEASLDSDPVIAWQTDERGTLRPITPKRYQDACSNVWPGLVHPNKSVSPLVRETTGSDGFVNTENGWCDDVDSFVAEARAELAIEEKRSAVRAAGRALTKAQGRGAYDAVLERFKRTGWTDIQLDLLSSVTLGELLAALNTELATAVTADESIV